MLGFKRGSKSGFGVPDLASLAIRWRGIVALPEPAAPDAPAWGAVAIRRDPGERKAYSSRWPAAEAAIRRASQRSRVAACFGLTTLWRASRR